jgi:hypothetical protein
MTASIGSVAAKSSDCGREVETIDPKKWIVRVVPS